ncbi:PE-PGRS family protein [Nitrospirillum viridazoti Y2]|nr:PE-PGRS family protein [Nitrospirillum amazonense Y2]
MDGADQGGQAAGAEDEVLQEANEARIVEANAAGDHVGVDQGADGAGVVDAAGGAGHGPGIAQSDDQALIVDRRPGRAQDGGVVGQRADAAGVGETDATLQEAHGAIACHAAGNPLGSEGDGADAAQVVEGGGGPHQGAAIAQCAQRARGRHVDGVAGADGAGVVQRTQRAADIVVGPHHHQVGAGGAAGQRQTGDGVGGGDRDAAIAGAGAAGDQGGAPLSHQIIEVGRDAGDDGAAGHDRGTTGHDLGAVVEGERAGRLIEIAGDVQERIQHHRRAAVDQCVAGDVHGVVQQQGARGQRHIADGVADQA